MQRTGGTIGLLPKPLPSQALESRSRIVGKCSGTQFAAVPRRISPQQPGDQLPRGLSGYFPYPVHHAGRARKLLSCKCCFSVSCDIRKASRWSVIRKFSSGSRGAPGVRVEGGAGRYFRLRRQCRDVDFVSLSDVPSFLPPAVGTSVLQRIRPALGEQALTVIRGHLHVVKPDCQGFCDVTAQFQNAIAREKTQLWRVQVYRQTSPVQVSR